MLGVLGGTVFLKKQGFEFIESKKVKTPFGTAEAFFGKEFAFIQRHGKKVLPPHSTNYHANIYAFKKLGITKIISINSTGSLKKSIKPGSFVVPHDFMQFSPKTFFNSKTVIITPSLSQKMRKKLLNACKKARVPVKSKAVYFQTIGPRLETPAEIRFLSKFADLVGMTMADEATLCNEQNIDYASICTVDNYANGIAKTLSYDEIVENASRNVLKLKRVIEGLK